MRDRIDADEEVELFPTFATARDDGGWDVRVHGWIYEPEADSHLREGLYALLLGALARLGVAVADSALTRSRIWPFLVDNERGERVPVTVGGHELTLTPSRPNGHFAATVAVEAPLARGASIELQAGPSVDGRRFGGTASLVGAHGLSVISDIDDTIKVTEVLDRRAMLANTFARPFRPVPGMAELYRMWAGEGVALHLVSSSPWQLHRALAAFLEAHGFPPASMHLKAFRATDPTLFDLFRSGAETKPATILPILDAFPGRRFVLVGDSGESDPEAYGEVARRRPRQIAAIAIRNVSGEAAGSDRMRAALVDVPRATWCLFDEPEEIAGMIEGLTLTAPAGS